MKTINEICTLLKEKAKDQDDIFVLSFRADGTYNFYKVLNKGSGLDGTEESFAEIKNIVFTDTADKERTDLLSYMEKFDFNSKKGDGELVVAFDGKTKTLNM